MTLFPFLCLGVGICIGIRSLPLGVLKLVDGVSSLALVGLMLTIGMNIGVNDSVMLNLGRIGIDCVIIILSAIFFSVLFTVIVEKTVLPLERMEQVQSPEKEKKSHEETKAALPPDKSAEQVRRAEGIFSPLLLLLPAGIVSGILIGYFFLTEGAQAYLSVSLYTSLVILYTGVGISLGANRSVFAYIQVVGFRVLFLPAAALAGSLTGGLLSGLALGVPLHIAAGSAAGMGYYSITGAYLTQQYGIEAGTYGFIVNVMRDFFTVLLLPLLIRISKGSVIASGAAGNMDTMLVPVTRFVGGELGLMAFITGAVLTFATPFLLPLVCRLSFML